MIERLTPATAAEYRSLMLQAYANEPEAFTSSVGERASLPIGWWEDRLSPDPDAGEIVLGAFELSRILGVVGLSFENRERTRHKAALFGMYVLPEARGRGLGRGLVEAALAEARHREVLRVVQLTVTEGNLAAEALYERCGFRRFGVEPMAVALGRRFLSKVHMTFDLRA